MSGVPPLQVIAHRIAWSCLLLLAWMLLRGELGCLAMILAHRALLARLALTALLISCSPDGRRGSPTASMRSPASRPRRCCSRRSR